MKRGSRNPLDSTLPLPRKVEPQPVKPLAVVGRLQETGAGSMMLGGCGQWNSEKEQRGGKESDV